MPVGMAALDKDFKCLSAKVLAENEENKKKITFKDEKNVVLRSSSLNLDFSPETPKRKARPGNLGFGTSASHGSFSPLSFPCPEKRCLDKSSKFERQFQTRVEISSVLSIKDKKYPFTLDDLEFAEEMGKGTCGVVNRAIHKKSNTIMAVKTMSRTPIMEEQNRILMDLDVITKCNDCPFIVECYGTILSQSDVYICMELMDTCLEKILHSTKRPIPEPILGKVSLSVVKALHYLKEKHGVMHRDVKPSNILIGHNGCVKLCDFGISGRLVDSKAKTRSAGCAAYMAPERIDPPDPSNPGYDIRADVWSLGISLVELADGEFPYRNCSNEFEILSSIINEDAPTLRSSSQFSKSFQDFVAKCLVKDFNHRWKFHSLLQHEFVKSYEKKFVDIGGWHAKLVKKKSHRH